MSTHRNDPCPCGSGQKYKRCCLPRDQKAERTLHLVGDDGGHLRRRRDLADLEIGTSWQAELVPIMARFDADPTVRPALALVVADGFVLHHELVAHPPAEPAAIAAVLAEAVDAASEAARVEPSVVEVRFAAVAGPLAERLAARHVTVREVAQLPLLDAVVDDFAAHVPGDPVEAATPAPAGLRASAPVMWAGWGLPRAQIARLFAAAARYHRAAPWRDLANEQALRVELPDGGAWTITVLGNGGQEFGLALYGDPDDLQRLLAERGDETGLLRARGAVLSLLFEPADELPRPMRREIREARWELADPGACPALMALNTPGGGVTGQQMDDLIAALDVVPRFVDRHRRGLQGEEVLHLPLRWRDAETGAVVEYTGFAIGGSDASPWEAPEVLAPALPTGPAADPEAALDAPELPDDPYEIDVLVSTELEVVERFFAYLQTPDSGRAVAAATAEKHARAADSFVDFLAGEQRVPVRAVTEYDLRVFLYEWFPHRSNAPLTVRRSLPGSLGRFFAYLEKREGITCDWAATILRDTDSVPGALRDASGRRVVVAWSARLAGRAVRRPRRARHAARRGRNGGRGGLGGPRGADTADARARAAAPLAALARRGHPRRHHRAGGGSGRDPAPAAGVGANAERERGRPDAR